MQSTENRRLHLHLHERRKDAQYVLKKPLGCAYGTGLRRNANAFGKHAEKVISHSSNHAAAIDGNAAFIMQVQAAVIEVHRADRRYAIIGNKGFCVIEAVLVFVNLYACFDKLPVIGTRCNMHKTFIPALRR